MKRLVSSVASLASLIIALGASAGCAADVDDLDDGEEDVLVSEDGLSSNATFNNEDDHFEQEVRLPRGRFGIYDREGSLLTTVDSTQARGWIQGHERVDTRVGALYWLWGFKSGIDVSGFVRAGVVGGERRVAAAGERGAPNRNGRAAPLTGRRLRVAITPLPDDFRHATTKDWRAGRPGDVNRVGQYAVAPVSASHAYLSWSVPWDAQAKRPLKGGGIVRSVVADGATFHLAAVRDIEMPAYSANRQKIGTVTWSYGFVRQNGERVFGWMVRRHQRAGSPAVDHLM